MGTGYVVFDTIFHNITFVFLSYGQYFCSDGVLMQFLLGIQLACRLSLTTSVSQHFTGDLVQKTLAGSNFTFTFCQIRISQNYCLRYPYLFLIHKAVLAFGSVDEMLKRDNFKGASKAATEQYFFVLLFIMVWRSGVTNFSDCGYIGVVTRECFTLLFSFLG